MNFLKPSLLILLTFLLSCSNNNKEIHISDGIWIKNVTIISPESDKIEPFTGSVIIENDTILYVGKDKLTLTGNFKEIDATGKYLIPGLIDSHVHLGYVAGLSTRLTRQHPELAKPYFEQLPKSYLYFGYTTLIDPNNFDPELINRIKDSDLRPDIYTCGEQVKVMNDVFMAEETQEDRYKYYPEFLHDKYNKNVVIPDSVDLTKHSVESVVSKIVHEQDGICIKTNFEDGYGGTEELTWELPSIEIIEDIVQQAKTENVPVLLHANSYTAQKFGYDSGVDIIAHGMWHWGLLKDFVNIKELPETHKELLRNIAKANIGYQPTFRVIGGQKDVFTPEFINDENLENVLPENLLQWLKTEEGLWQKKRIYTYGGDLFNENNEDRVTADFFQLIVDKITTSTNHLYENNANLIFATDTPAMNSHTNPPGYNGFLEMKEWVKAGISLEQLLKSATINNAKEFNIDNLYGSIQSGKIANLILMNKNPLQDINAYNDIYKVIMRGAVIDRGVLSAKSKY